MTKRSIVHATFTVERTYDAAPKRVFAAWADPEIKAKWFGAPTEADGKRSFDFRVGGKESSSGKADGKSYSFDALYQDIIPNERIIYTYDMHLEGQRISVSRGLDRVQAGRFRYENDGHRTGCLPRRSRQSGAARVGHEVADGPARRSAQGQEVGR